MDTDIVVRAQQGDQASFASLTEAIDDRFHGVAFGILRDMELAQDAVQVALLTLWRDLPKLRDPAAFEAWSYRLLVRACYAESRRARRWLPNLAGGTAGDQPVEGGFAAVVDRDQLERGFRRLSMDQRAVVVLHHYLEPGRAVVVARYFGGEWTMLPAVPSGTAVGDGGSLAVTPDGIAWLAIDPYNTGKIQRGGLLRFDGERWGAVADVDVAEPISVGPVVGGPDGTVWAYGVGEHHRVEEGEDPSAADRWLRRYADGAWTAYGVADGVPVLVNSQMYTPEMEVAPDGTLWIAFTLDLRAPMGVNHGQGGVLDVEQTDGPCPGVLSFDGEAWGRHLPGYCATDVAVGLDGRIWVTVASREPQGRAGIYVIDPEVAMADR